MARAVLPIWDMASHHDYDSLRAYVPVRPRDPAHGEAVAHDPKPSSKIGVMDWLVAVGQAVARRVRHVPASPMRRIHGR